MPGFPLRTTRLLLLALLVTPALMGCTRRSAAQDNGEGIESLFTISPDPVRVGQATLEIQLKGEGGEALTGVALAVRGDMTHAGMRVVLAEAKEVRPGTYQANLEWTMAGDWILSIDGTLPDGSAFTRQLDVSVAP